MKKTSGSSSITLSIVLPLIPLFLTLLFFEWVISKNWIPAYLIPAPTEVLSSLYQNSGKLWRAAAETGLCALAGFSLSLFVGILLGALLSSSQIAQKIFYPYAVFFQTVPIISIAPLLVIWFGYGTPTTIAASFIVSVFPVMANTLSSILSTDRSSTD